MAMNQIRYREAPFSPGLVLSAAIAGLFIMAGLGAFWYMEHNGHIVTGMNNGIVWGLPHVFAIFLIVSASGILNMASLASVFGNMPYKPKARLSGLMAIALLAGGLAVLVLDLGRPDRLTVAMTSYNFKSIFAWNIFLYTGFLVIVIAYLVVQMTRRWQNLTRPVGTLAFVWRLVLTTGTGSIFGWLVARQAYNAAIMAPLFIAMSLAFGLAIFLLARMALARDHSPMLDTEMLARLARLLGIFVAVVLYFSATMHLTNLYSASRTGVVRFLLVDGGIYPMLYWLGAVLAGGIIPMLITFTSAGHSHSMVALASTMVVLGGLAHIYVIVIGGQAFPLELFPGMEVSSSFADGIVHSYTPSLYEILLGLGGVGIAMIATIAGVKFLPILPVGSAGDAAAA